MIYFLIHNVYVDFCGFFNSLWHKICSFILWWNKDNIIIIKSTHLKLFFIKWHCPHPLPYFER